ncbi:MAG: hypothetical protein J1G07_07000 [Clostridiales bacterium]|nr:hypothetical protein [Clostridiales bacterium]
MVRYVKCPRCELNYINEDEQEYCEVCIAEMKGSKLKFADLEELEDVTANEFDDICPVCGVGSIRPGEKMCDNCRLQQEYEEDEDVDMEKDEEWKNYLEEDEASMSSEPAIQLELPDDDDYDDYDEEEDEEYEEEADPLDDFEDIGDYDYDDEDDEDDYDDEDDEDF